MKRRRQPYLKAEPFAVNPWIDGHVPSGYVLFKTDENGLILHWSEWRLEAAP